MSARELITDHLDLWTGAVTNRSTAGRARHGKIELTGIKKLRELILELAVRGKLVEQDPSDERAGVLLERIAEEKARLVKEGKIKKPKTLPEITEEEKPFSTPTNWAWKRLGDIGFTQTGSTPSKSNQDFFGKDIPFIKPADISDSGIRHDNEGLSKEGLEELGKWAEKDSILMVCIGTIGKCGIITKKACFNQQINSITVFDNQMSKFALLCLKSPYFQKLAWENSSSTTISILNKGKWSTIPIPVPSLDEQHRIVEKVDELMALCDRLEQQVGEQLEAHEVLVDTLLGSLFNPAEGSLTRSADAAEVAEKWARIAEHFDTLFTTETSIEKLKQTILQLAVMGRLVEQDPDDEPASVLLERIAEERARLVKEGKVKKPKSLSEISEEEKPFELPSGWAWVQLGRVCELENGDRSKNYPNKSALVEIGVPFVNAGHLENFSVSKKELTFITEERFNLLRSGKFQDGDILFCLRGSLGKCGLVQSIGRGAVASSLIIARPLLSKLTSYLMLYLKAPIAGVMVKRYDNGTAQPNLSGADFGRFLIPLPGKNEQHRIVEKVDELMALCDQLKARLGEAGETRTHLAEAVVEQAVS